MKRGFRRNGMEASGLAIFAVVVLAVVGILLLEVGAVRGVTSGKGNPEITGEDVGRVVAAQQGWQSYEDSVAMSGIADIAPQIEPVVDPAIGPTDRTAAEPLDRTGIYREAETLYKAAQYSKAAEAFSVWTREMPGDPWGQYMLGLSAWKSGAHVQAIAALRTAIALDPEHVKSYVNLARALLDAGRTWEALEAIQEAVLRDPGAPAVRRVLGRCYHETDQFEDAELAYKQAITLDPRDVWALNNLGLLYIEQYRFDEALYVLANAALVNDGIAEVQNNLGVALERTGHPLAAIQAYARALEIDAAYDKAQISLARVQPLADSVADEDVDLAALAAQFTLDDAEQPVAEEAPENGPESAPGLPIDAGSLSSDVAR